MIRTKQAPPPRSRGWPLWGWLVLLLCAVATVAYELRALFWLAFGVSGEHPDPGNIAAAQAAAWRLALVVLAPWAVAALVLRPRLRVLVTGLLCAAPAAFFWWSLTRMG